jgi:hypothetical protein
LPPQIDASVIAYYALLLEAEKKSWDAVTGGASMDSATFDAALIARLGQMLSNDLNKKDQPSVCTAALQVGPPLNGSGRVHACKPCD